MKTKILLVFLLGILATTGSTCINDGFLVAVNMPLEMCFNINAPGPQNFSGQLTIKLADEIDASYLDKLKNARYYDIQVQVTGTFSGDIINGEGLVNNKKIVDFAGKWDDFKTPQSLLAGSKLLKTDTTGVKELVAVLNQFKTQPSTTIVLSGKGVLSAPPTPGLSVCLKILTQLDAEVK
jgi:hypothetical protein